MLPTILRSTFDSPLNPSQIAEQIAGVTSSGHPMNFTPEEKLEDTRWVGMVSETSFRLRSSFRTEGAKPSWDVTQRLLILGRVESLPTGARVMVRAEVRWPTLVGIVPLFLVPWLISQRFLFRATHFVPAAVAGICGFAIVAAAVYVWAQFVNAAWREINHLRSVVNGREPVYRRW